MKKNIKQERRKDLLKSYYKISETQLRLSVCKHLLYLGFWGGKNNTQGTFLKKYKTYIKDPYLLHGVPDLFFFKNDIMLGIELKVDKNVQSNFQIEFQKWFHRPELKRYYLLAYNMDTVLDFVKGLEKGGV